MYRFIFTLIVIPTFFFGQVGVNTLYPIGVFHVDGGGDNPASSPTVGQEANDVVINSSGWVGIGINVPTKALDVNGSVRVRSIASASVLADFSPRIWASDTSGNLATLTAAQVVSEGGGLSHVNVNSPIAGNGTVGSPISLNDLGVTTIKLADNAVTTAKISNANVTYAKIQNVAASRLLGNPTGSAAAPSEIGLGSGLAFDGTNLVAKPIVTIPLITTPVLINNTTGAELVDTRTSFLPSIINATGNVQMKLVLFCYVDAGVTNLQFKGWNGSTDNYFFTTADTWNYYNRGGNVRIVETLWKDVSVGTESLQLSFHAWVNNNSTSIKNAYLLVRSQ